jgi:hypothetical protein
MMGDYEHGVFLGIAKNKSPGAVIFQTHIFGNFRYIVIPVMFMICIAQFHAITSLIGSFYMYSDDTGTAAALDAFVAIF